MPVSHLFQCWISLAAFKDLSYYIYLIVWKDSQHFAMPALVSPWKDVWEMSTEILFFTDDA